MTLSRPQRTGLALLGFLVLFAACKSTWASVHHHIAPVHVMQTESHDMHDMDQQAPCCDTNQCQNLCIHAALAVPQKMDNQTVIPVNLVVESGVFHLSNSPPERIDRPPIV